MSRALAFAAAALACVAPRAVTAACPWGFPVGDDPSSPAPLADNHPVGGMNLPDYGAHLGADFWSGGGCTDLGRTVYAVADGEIVEIVDALGSYLDVVVIRHDEPTIGPIYSMYGHISRDDALAEGDMVAMRQPIGTIADVLAYFSPCHLHFELSSEAAYQEGPFCNGCANAGYHVSPGYDQQQGTTPGMARTGDPYIEVDDAIADNRWYRVDEFIQARLDADCAPCEVIPPDGATLDETGACFGYGGDPTYWHVEAVGWESSLRWTHTTDSEVVDNYGVWSFTFAEAGEYRLEVYVEDAFGASTMASYDLVHAGATESIALDQAAASGWTELGTFDFAEGGDQSLRLDDNTGEPFATMTMLTFDAVRLTRTDAPTTTGNADTTAADDVSASAENGDDDGDTTTANDDTALPTTTAETGSLPGTAAQEIGEDGCTCTSPRRNTTSIFAMLAVLLLRRRR
jgi:hypothetical protein